MRKRILASIFFIVVFILNAFSIKGPSASFQIRWHVENTSVKKYNLRILDYTCTAEISDSTSVHLIFTSAEQGLCTYEFKTNVVRQNHTFMISATPLTHTPQSGVPEKLSFNLKVLIGESSAFSFVNNMWTGEENISSVNLAVSSSSPISSNSAAIEVVHPQDTNRKIVTFMIPVSVQLPPETLSEVSAGVTYISEIAMEVISP